MRNYTKEMLLMYLKKGAIELGHTPSEHEMNQFKNYPSSTTYINRFGSWNNALKAARLNIRKVKQYTQEELCGTLKIIYTKTHRTPTQIYFKHHKNLPTISIFLKMFGSWEGALKIAGIPSNKYSRRYRKKDLLQQVCLLRNSLHRIPHSTDLRQYPEMPSAATYFRRFKTWKRVLVEAKFTPKQTTLKEYS